MRTKRGTAETLRWPASEVYLVSRSSKALQTASAKSMMRLRRQTNFRDWSPERAEIGRLCRARHNRPYAECRIMPSTAGERQRGGHRILGVLGIIRAPTGTPEVSRLA